MLVFLSSASSLFGPKTRIICVLKTFEHILHTRRKRTIFWGKFNVPIITVLTFLGLCRKSTALKNALFYLWHSLPRISHLLFIVLTPGINRVTLWWVFPAETTRLRLRTICLRKLNNKACPFCTKATSATRATLADRKGINLRREN